MAGSRSRSSHPDHAAPLDGRFEAGRARAAAIGRGEILKAAAAGRETIAFGQGPLHPVSQLLGGFVSAGEDRVRPGTDGGRGRLGAQGAKPSNQGFNAMSESESVPVMAGVEKDRLLVRQFVQGEKKPGNFT